MKAQGRGRWLNFGGAMSMSARLRERGLGLLVAAAATAGLAVAPTALSGCTDANDGLVIVQAEIPARGADGICRPTDEGIGGQPLSEGVLDLGLDQAYGYDLYPLVSNNLPVTAIGMGIEPNRISVNAVEMTVVPPDGLAIAWPEGCGAKFDDASSAVIPPGERRSLKVSALRACHARVIRDLFGQGKLNPALTDRIKFRVIARAKGRHGGTEILSNPFEFPIRVCYGCLQTGFEGQYAAFSFAMSPPKIIACENLAENPYKGNACNPAQDIGPILCCAQDAKGETLICPAIPGATPATAVPPSAP